MKYPKPKHIIQLNLGGITIGNETS